ncbi:MAG: hypothetical protein KGY44_00595 [Halanaerobiales bacterium]|nr:hypothetical protein [Halanaerobiales bacterium]
MTKQESGDKQKNQFISIKYFIFIIVIVTVIVLFFILSEDELKITQIEYKEVIDGFEAKALLVRDEKAYNAEISGELNIIISEGERASYGENIAFIENEAEIFNIYAQEAGIISFALDGLEKDVRYGKITPELLDNYGQLNREYKQYVSGNMVDKGEKIYKNINNFQQYLLIKVEKERAQKFNKNEVVFVDTQSDNEYSDIIQASIKKIYIHNNQYFLLLKLDRYVKMWNNTRWVNIELIKNIYRGLAVPRSAVFKTTSGDQVLIYTFDHKIKTREIKIVEETEDWVIIENLEIGDRVLRNPQAVNYGRDEK